MGAAAREAGILGLVTPAARFARNLIEKLLKRFYEGPEPPGRIAEEVTLFGVIYPMATPDEWADFAAKLAANAYRSGYTRGVEASERDPQPLEPDLQLLEAQRHDWSLADGHPLMRDVIERGRDPLDPLRTMTREQRAAYFDQVGHATGAFRVLVLDEQGIPLSGPEDGG